MDCRLDFPSVLTVGGGGGGGGVCRGGGQKPFLVWIVDPFQLQLSSFKTTKHIAHV